MTRALGLTDPQLVQLSHAAAMLPQSRRDTFLRSVANRLTHQPTNRDVQQAISLALGMHGVAVGNHFFEGASHEPTHQ
jgi:hypothetical protein